MEKIKIGLFDFFGYIIPGALILFSLATLLDKDTSQVYYMYEILNKLTLTTTISLTIISYVIGVSSHSIGYALYRFITPKLWKNRKAESYLFEYDRSKYLVLAREYSPNNMKYIEEWIAKRALCYNLSVGLLMFSVVGVIKILQNPNNYLQWLILCICVISLSILLLRRATSFDKWYLTDLYNTVEELNLRNNEDQITKSTIPNKS